MSFEVDSILRKKSRNAMGNMILAEAYINGNINYYFKQIKRVEFCDSLYPKYGDSVMYGVRIEKYINSFSMIDTAKALDYFNQALALDPDNKLITYYACFFYYKIKDKEKTCFYLKRMQPLITSENSQKLFRIGNSGIPFDMDDISSIEEFCNK
jgi:tetratricopeptide (TPR) repeat protein